jgi:hypothetical protein
MYIAVVEGESERTLGLSGVYRMVALANPAEPAGDGRYRERRYGS